MQSMWLLQRKTSPFQIGISMKTAFDPRHKKRQDIVQLLFSYSFMEQPLHNEVANDILTKLEEIDTIITTIAPEFPIDKINKVDLSILRLAIYELQFDKKAPPKVIVDEAIELAKEFGGEASPGFINGSLGKLLKSK